MNIIRIILYFKIFPFFHYYRYNIFSIKWISLHRTVGPFVLFFSCYSQYNCYLQYRYNHDYFRLLFDYIAYSASTMGKHCVLVIIIHTLILRLLRLGLSHKYNIHNNKGWLFVIVPHFFFDRFVWYCSVFTQYSYYCELVCLGPASGLREWHSHV